MKSSNFYIFAKSMKKSKNLIKALAVIILDMINFLVNLTSILFIIKKTLNMITVNEKTSFVQILLVFG